MDEHQLTVEERRAFDDIVAGLGRAPRSPVAAGVARGGVLLVVGSALVAWGTVGPLPLALAGCALVALGWWTWATRVPGPALVASARRVVAAVRCPDHPVPWIQRRRDGRGAGGS